MHARIAPHARKPRFGEVDEISDDLFQHFPRKKPAQRPTAKQTSRVPTRILGFAEVVVNALVPQEPASAEKPLAEANASSTVGWLTIVDGPGRGVSVGINQRVTSIGRSDDQDMQLAYGDDSISRHGHATIHYNPDRNTVLIEDGGKPNPVVLNGKVLNGMRELMHGDRLTIGVTKLRFSRRPE